MGTLALLAAAVMVMGTAGSAAPVTDAANPAPQERSSATAVALSLGATVLGYGALAADVAIFPKGGVGPLFVVPVGLSLVFFGPSAGQFYSGDAAHGLVTSGMRVGTVGFSAAGLFVVAAGCAVDRSCNNGFADAGAVLAVAGVLSFAGLTVYDIVDAAQAPVRVHRREMLQKRPVSLLPAPVVVRDRLLPGAVLAVRF